MFNLGVTQLLLIAALLMLALALRSARNIPLFFICAVPALATLLHEPTVRTLAQRTRHPAPGLAFGLLVVCVFAAFAFVAYAWRTPLPSLGGKPLGQETIAAIAACEGPLYNRYDEGGYLEWFLRDRKVFMDSRQDPFPPELVLDQIRVEKTGDYESTFRQYDIRCALTPAGSPLSLRLERDGWRPRPGAGPWIVYSRPVGRSPSGRL